MTYNYFVVHKLEMQSITLLSIIAVYALWYRYRRHSCMSHNRIMSPTMYNSSAEHKVTMDAII